ncbi:MAG TPA: SpoIIE family protein phosphatase [Gemmatimonadales bacterium]|nr:SpoIIE family protein phosphatase [Gemmatimonadales bacterium]
MGGRIRLWRFDGRRLRPLGSADDPAWSPTIPSRAGLVPTPTGSAWLAPIPEAEGFWLEVSGGVEEVLAERSTRLLPIFVALFAAERETAEVTEELASRYEEIDLLYAISEILGQTVQLEEAAQTILREVSSVVRARRASIMVFDDQIGVLRTVAARGFDARGLDPVKKDDQGSVAARAFRDNRIVAFDPGNPTEAPSVQPDGRPYLGRAFMSIPICYGAPGSAARCVGVINLTDRLGGDAFTVSDRKLMSAVAHQIGAAIENARLVDRDLRQQRLRHELQLAHDLQLRLLPAPSLLQGDAEVAARCLPAESVGGDFYTFSRLGQGRVGVMLGDVSSHGFSAALVMALVMAAAGIHAGAGNTPDETLTALLESLGDELTSTEMYLSVFYGVLDPKARRLVYANAGHQHAFRVPLHGEPERLSTTAPPLGLSAGESIQRRQVPWAPRTDLLCLWTDGLVDNRTEGPPFTEHELLAEVCRRRTEPVESIVEAVLAQAATVAPKQMDDRTLLVMRI